MNMSSSRSDPKLKILVGGGASQQLLELEARRPRDEQREGHVGQRRPARHCTRPLRLAGDRKNMLQNLGFAYLYVSADALRPRAEI